MLVYREGRPYNEVPWAVFRELHGMSAEQRVEPPSERKVVAFKADEGRGPMMQSGDFVVSLQKLLERTFGRTAPHSDKHPKWARIQNVVEREAKALSLDQYDEVLEYLRARKFVGWCDCIRKILEPYFGFRKPARK